jgi:hypothetical protein
MIEVRKTIKSQLKSIHPHVYFLKAPSNAQFPYLVYTVELTDLGDGLRMVTLDVDGWDNQDDTTALETLMSNVRTALDRNLSINESLFLSFYLDRQLALTDENPQLNRRSNIFMGRLYER